jgi:hypothetical protein
MRLLKDTPRLRFEKSMSDRMRCPEPIPCPHADAIHRFIAQDVLPFWEELGACGGTERQMSLDLCVREHEQLIGLVPFGLRHLWVGTDLCDRRGREDQQQDAGEKMTRLGEYVQGLSDRYRVRAIAGCRS